MRILTKFLMRRFFGGVAIVLTTVCGVIFATTFVERLPSNPTVIAAISDTWVRLLEYIPLFLPIAIFMGTLLAAYNLTKSSELIIISNSGVSPFQSAKPFLTGALLIGIFSTTVVNPYSIKLSSGTLTRDDFVLVDNTIWLRESSERGVITLRAQSINSSDFETLTFTNATILTQTPDFKPVARIESPSAILSNDGLDFESAKIWDRRGNVKTQKHHLDTVLNPKTVLDRYLQPSQVSFWQLPGFIKKMRDIGAPVRGHLVQFWTLLSLPLTLIAMTLLGVAFSQTKQRRNYNFIAKFSVGIITCFALYFLTNLFGALGASGALPATLAVLAPTLIIIAIGGIMIASFDVN